MLDISVLSPQALDCLRRLFGCFDSQKSLSLLLDLHHLLDPASNPGYSSIVDCMTVAMEQEEDLQTKLSSNSSLEWKRSDSSYIVVVVAIGYR